MALTTASLAARIIAEINTAEGGPPLDSAKLNRFAEALAKAIVDEIQANAIVNTTVVTPDTINGTGVGTVS